MVDRLTKLITIYENPALDFSSNRADGDDLLGDAYEYLISNFAKDSGKRKGNFFTPLTVCSGFVDWFASLLMSRIVAM
ncbi:MAG: SAM-dependent methyltransferase [Methanospirillum hungatei]|nr:SAM-dependent methyltransferase [Methanospirillum hungatei]